MRYNRGVSDYRDEKETLRRRVVALERQLEEVTADDADDRATIANVSAQRDALEQQVEALTEERDDLAHENGELRTRLEREPASEWMPKKQRRIVFGGVSLAFLAVAVLQAWHGQVGRFWMLNLIFAVGALFFALGRIRKRRRGLVDELLEPKKKKKRKPRVRVETKPPRQHQLEARKRQGKRRRKRRR